MLPVDDVVQMSPSIPPFDEFEARRCCRGPHDAFKWMLKMQTAPEDTAAIIIEPILGEGGFVAPPPDFLSTLRKHCDEHNIVMIIDEVSSAPLITGERNHTPTFGSHHQTTFYQTSNFLLPK